MRIRWVRDAEKRKEIEELFEAELKLRPKNIKNVEDLKTTPYPPNVNLPDLEFNFLVEPGRFRYHRNFLMQFMNVCTERPVSLVSLDLLGLDPREASSGYPTGSRARGRGRALNSLSRGGGPSAQRQASIGLGLGSELGNRRGFPMGNFQSPSTSQSRFETSNASRARGTGFARGGFRRDDHGRRDVGDPDGWNVGSGAGATRPSAHAGDLSQFGKITKPTGIQFGPSSVFGKQDSNRRDNFGRPRGVDNVNRGGPRRGEYRGGNAEPDGWNVASGAGTTRPSVRAGDLSQFGKISKPTGIQFGPSSVFSKTDANGRDPSIGRASGANMFALIANAANGPPPPVERTTSSRKPSVDLGPGGSPAAGFGERKRLNLLPRTKPTKAEDDKAGDKEEDKEEGKEKAASTAMTEEEALTKFKEDVKEYLGVENIDEAITALEALPSERRHLFVDKLVNTSMDGGNKVVVLAEKLFSAAHSRSVISPEGFERGLLPTIEMADDLSIDVPKTYEWLARMMYAAGLDKAKTEEMAGKISVYGEPRVPPRELLMKEYDKVSSA